jgi:hypothetical protein
VHALNILLRLSFDDNVIFDVGTYIIVQDAIKNLIDGLPDSKLSQNVFPPLPYLRRRLIISQLQTIINNLLTTIQDPVLQNQLASTLPTSTPLTHIFQRRLALSFFLYPTPFTDSLTSPHLPAIIHNYLSTSPHFQISRDFSYTALGSRMSLLDKAIGPGFSTLSFLPPTAASATASAAATSATNTPVPPSLEEKAFNESIDLLASRIKWIANRIVDTGTSGMDRCEAKSICQMLHYRLEGAVRTRGRKLRGAFGGGEDEDEGRLVFKRWLGGEGGRGGGGNVVQIDVNGG